MPKTKICNQCKKRRSLKEFTRNRGRPDGLEYYCKSCAHQQYLRKKQEDRVYRHYETAECDECGKEYQPTSGNQRFCSRQCYFSSESINFPKLVCERCGVSFGRRGRHGGRARFCSRDCWRASRPGQWVDSNGYIRMYIDAGRPRMLVHRYKMEERLGRALLPTETVHHIDGVKTNNAIENLQLRQGRHGKGSIFACMDCGSTRIVARPLV